MCEWGQSAVDTNSIKVLFSKDQRPVNRIIVRPPNEDACLSKDMLSGHLYSVSGSLTPNLALLVR